MATVERVPAESLSLAQPIQTVSTQHRDKLRQQPDKLPQRRAELEANDEKPPHDAEMKIILDLDDGVKDEDSLSVELISRGQGKRGGQGG